MEQLKQHYEKAILGLAMLALVYVAYGVLTDNSEEAIAEQREAREPGPLKVKKEMPPMEMRGYQATLARLEKAEPLNLSNPHNLFNPVQWRVTRQGTTLKVELGHEIGAGAIVLSETRPLYLKIEYRGTTGTAPNTRYRFAVTREAAETKKKRLRMTTTAQLNDKDTRDMFTLIKIVGASADPTAFELQLANNAGNITVENTGNLLAAAILYEQAQKGVESIGAGAKGIDAESAATVEGLTRVRLALGEKHATSGNLTEARKQVQRVLVLSPGNLQARGQLQSIDAQLEKLRGRMPSEETIGEVKDVIEEKIQAATLVQDGKLLYEMARYDQAEAKLRQALKVDPANRGASYYMVLVQEAKNTIQVKKRDMTSREAIKNVTKDWVAPTAHEGLIVPRSLWFALAHEGFRVFSGSDDGAGGLQRWRRTPGGTGRNANASVA